MANKKGFPGKVIQNLGRLIGRLKTKERDIVEQFIDTCNATGQKPTDVLLNFMAWFIEQGGTPIIDVGAISKQKKIGETFTEINSVQQIADMAKKAIADNLQREMELKQTMIQMSQDYANTFAQLQQQTSELQRQLIEFRKQQDQLSKERQQIEIDKAQVSQAAKELQEQWKQLERAHKEIQTMKERIQKEQHSKTSKQSRKE